MRLKVELARVHQSYNVAFLPNKVTKAERYLLYQNATKIILYPLCCSQYFVDVVQGVKKDNTKSTLLPQLYADRYLSQAALFD